MHRQVFPAPNQQRFGAVMLNYQGRCVAVVSFDRRLEIARYFPSHLAGAFIERRQPGLAFVHPRHDDVIFGQHGRRAMVPEQRVAAEAFHEVGLPLNLAVQANRGERPTLKIDEHAFAIRGRRRIAPRAVAVFAGIFLAEFSGPKLLAGPVISDQRIPPADRRCDDPGRTARAGRGNSRMAENDV